MVWFYKILEFLFILIYFKGKDLMYFKSFCYIRNRVDFELLKWFVFLLFYGFLEVFLYRFIFVWIFGRWGCEIFVLKNLLLFLLYSVYFLMYIVI